MITNDNFAAGDISIGNHSSYEQGQGRSHKQRFVHCRVVEFVIIFEVPCNLKYCSVL